MIAMDSQQRTLIVLSTYNRKDLTGITLDSISRNKFPRTEVVILDDASTEYDGEWLAQWGFHVQRRENHLGVGPAAQSRFYTAATSPPGFGFFILVDNDMIFDPLFDCKIRSAWEHISNIRKSSNFLLSGYRSITYDVISECDNIAQVQTLGGACLAINRSMASTVLETLGGDWEFSWDRNTSKWPCYTMVQSAAQHLGIHGGGENRMSWDVAFENL